MRNEQQLTGAGTLSDANTFTIDRPIRFTYSSTSITGNALASYADAELDLTFTGDEITRVDTVLGELVTVTLENVADAFVRTFTVVVPTIRLALGESAEFDTFGLETVDRSGAFVPPPGPSGVLQEYAVHSLHGVAQQVIS